MDEYYGTIKEVVRKLLNTGYSDKLFDELEALEAQCSDDKFFKTETFRRIAPSFSKIPMKELKPFAKELQSKIIAHLSILTEKEITYYQAAKLMIAVSTLSPEKPPSGLEKKISANKKSKVAYNFIYKIAKETLNYVPNRQVLNFFADLDK